MEFAEVVRRRRMVRRYQVGRSPDRTLLVELMGLAVRAPSAGFSQGWHFVVLDEPDSLGRFWDTSTDPDATVDSWLSGMLTAPVLILALSDREVYLDRYAETDKGWTDRDVSRWPVPYWDVDTGMACMTLLLAAVDRGLAGCFFGVPVERLDAVRAALEIPHHLNVVGVVSLGYPAPEDGAASRRSRSLRRGRRPLPEVVSYGGYRKPASRETSPTSQATESATSSAESHP
jgi:nitroreductase